METGDRDEPFIDPDLIAGNKLFITTTKNSGMEPHHEINPHHPREEGSVEKYDWVKVIGQGTFGVVYKVTDKDLKKNLAIKKVFQDPNYRNREFMIVVELNHINCIKVHNYFFTRDGAQTFLNLVMDYIPETLYRVLRYYKKKNMDFPDPLGKIYSYQMFRALAYIHALGIVHRDIKPQNILVDTNDHRLVICDFGSAKKIQPGEKSVAYICSRYYRAPELILEQDKYGPEIDVWSIGCVIAEMFLGEPIFPGTSSRDQMIKIITLLGTPTAPEIQAMSRSANVRLPQVPAQGLTKKFGPKTNPLVIDLLSKILVYDPKKRLHPLEALMHPYFDELRNQKLTINGKEIVNLFNFTTEEVSFKPSLLQKLIPSWVTNSTPAGH
jgi:glycogen synthase kinase 3 beta